MWRMLAVPTFDIGTEISLKNTSSFYYGSSGAPGMVGWSVSMPFLTHKHTSALNKQCTISRPGTLQSLDGFACVLGWRILQNWVTILSATTPGTEVDNFDCGMKGSLGLEAIGSGFWERRQGYGPFCNIQTGSNLRRVGPGNTL
jgi:hypothetical protein